MTTVLLTGFVPFGGDAHNPSGEAVELVAGSWSGPAQLVTAVLPVSFAEAAAQLEALIAEVDPDVVIATGLAGGRSAVSVERVAVNLQDARIPDNAGAQPVDTEIVTGGDAALFTSLPAKQIAAAIAEAGIPSELSMSAGAFVCNDVFYRIAQWAASNGRSAGFIHLPWASGQAPAGEPELPLADIARALGIAVQTAADASAARRVDANAAIPPRRGKRPKTSTEGAHAQLSDRSSAAIWGELVARTFALPGVSEVHSQVSPASSRAIRLDDLRTARHPSTSLSYEDPLEPVHLHGIDDTSIHLCLPKDLVATVLETGWGELHPYGDHGTEVMIYGPRDAAELEVVMGLIEASLAFARGDRG
jgi:pyroglutamyl-peptidase